MQKYIYLKKIKLFTILSLLTLTLYGKDFNITHYGAVNDGKTINTLSIQKAIDECNAFGGGRVIINGGGTYVSGTLFMKSNVTLFIDNGSTLQGSLNQNDYPSNVYKNMYRGETTKDRCLIYAENENSIAIEGHGTIDGNGHKVHFPREKVNGKSIQRPMLLRFKDCSNITMRDIHLINPASWTTAWLYCDNITIDGITILSRANYNGDGLDFDGCTNVRVSNSNFDNSDDSICLQTSLPDKPCKYITISNCNFTTKWGGIRIGLLSRGNIEYVTVTNCTFRDIYDSGLKIQQNEGGEMRHMVFNNLVMENVPRPIFMTFCQQIASVDTPENQFEPLKRMHDMIFSNIIVDNSELDKNSAFFLTGIPGHQIENISINNVTFIVRGGGTIKDATQKIVKEYTLDNMSRWPEFFVVESLPTCGLYARHINGLTIKDFNIITKNEDKRFPFIFDKVKSLNTHMLSLNGKQLAKKELIFK